MPVGTDGRKLRVALNLVNTSAPRAVDQGGLRAALLDPSAPGQPAARILLEEASAPLLADLVIEGFVGWRDLAKAAERYPPGRHETAAWIRDMARLALA